MPPTITPAFGTNLPAVDIRQFGGVADGATDVSGPIASAVAAVSSTGGTITFPVGVFAATASITITDVENIHFQGAGGPNNLYFPQYNKGTWIRATSALTGAMLDWEASTAGQSLRGNGIQGIAFDCASFAGAGLKLVSHYGFICDDVHVQAATSVGIILNTVHLSGVMDFQGAHFRRVSINNSAVTAAKGMTWGSVAAGSGNVSLNRFDHLMIYTGNGTGLECGDSDHNMVGLLECNHSGTALALDLLGSNVANAGHCRTNRFEMVDGPGSVVSRATGKTQPAMFNYVGMSVGSNGATFPTIESGSNLVVADLWSV